ncbi:hypothetical protein CAPTEDRAFT_212081 [Capitella teleta]|uniref:C-type lectin domain-containing protein n=1 Tax=Capitella teleta TaxID=283909 RepID=R7VC34_CAPTE|nr:hypothetical protein CAPTEDRAFT_212081 [Capitella teleta]|eukprot:ELU13230.1 hypothetical protein CAPTEDRAFT_212081 [Capitella teleta]
MVSHPKTVKKLGKWDVNSCENEQSSSICQLPMQTSDAPTDSPDEGCPMGWSAYRWKCYYFSSIDDDWQSSNDTCEPFGATLVRIEDRFEQSFIVYSLGERGDTGYFWTDLSNQDDEETFKFSNGEIPEDYFWAEDHPSSSDDPSFVVMNANDHGHWENYPGDEEHFFICELQRLDAERLTQNETFFRASDYAIFEESNTGDDEAVSSGAVVGIALGVVFGVLLITLIGMFVYKHRLSSSGSTSYFDNPLHLRTSENQDF